MPLASGLSSSALRHLDWDSDHFQFPVAEIVSTDCNDEQLRQALQEAREARYGLVYWWSKPDRSVPGLLEEFHGIRVNHRITYRKDLNSSENFPADSSPIGCCQIEELPCGPAPCWLQDLAIIAGAYSRFSVDLRLPVEKFQSLFRIWVERCAQGELAHRVWYAVPSDRTAGPVGFVTVSEFEGVGQIGLIAVEEASRGQGIASQLMSTAHQWLRERGAPEVRVVTQLENEAACGLYARWCYQPIELVQCFHFLLSAAK